MKTYIFEFDGEIEKIRAKDMGEAYMELIRIYGDRNARYFWLMNVIQDK